MTARRRVWALLLTIGMLQTAAHAQQTSASAPALPSTARLSDIEIMLRSGGGGGCFGRCIAYRVTVRGTGIVEYRDLGGEPRDPDRQRQIAVDDVVSLLDSLLRAKFLELPDDFSSGRGAIRRGDSVLFVGRVGADGPEWDLALRVGTGSN